MMVTTVVPRLMCGILFAVGISAVVPAVSGEEDDSLLLDDRPLEKPLEFPDWFKLSFSIFAMTSMRSARRGRTGSWFISARSTAPTARPSSKRT
jgi:hypothetical protein